MFLPRFIPNDDWPKEPNMRCIGGHEEYDFWVYEGAWSSRFFQVTVVNVESHYRFGFEVRPCPQRVWSDYYGIESNALARAQRILGKDRFRYLLTFLSTFAPEVMQEMRDDIRSIIEERVE